MKTFLTVCTSGSVCALIQQTSPLPDRPKHLMSPLASCSSSCPLFLTKTPPQQKPFFVTIAHILAYKRMTRSAESTPRPVQSGMLLSVTKRLILVTLDFGRAQIFKLTFKHSAKRVTIMLKLAKKKRKSLLNMKYLHQSTDDGFGWNPVNNHTVYTLYRLRQVAVGFLPTHRRCVY